MNNEEKILQILEQIQGDISGLKQGQAKLEHSVANLEQGQAKLERCVASLEQGQASLEQGQREISRRLEVVDKKLDDSIEFSKDILLYSKNIARDVTDMKGTVSGVERIEEALSKPILKAVK